MRLAANIFRLTLGDFNAELRPSLRAAWVLYEKYDGFHNLSRHLAEGSLTTALDIISATIVNAKAWGEYSLPANAAVLRDLMAATGDLIEFVLLLAGADDASDKADAGTPMPFDQWFTSLFEIGAGWLSWPPEDVWDATPAEILAAQRGRIAMLKAILGKADDQSNDGSPSKDDLNAIGDLTNHVRTR